MKNITIQQFTKQFAQKVNLNIDFDNFAKFRHFASDAYSQFETEYETLDLQAYHYENCSTASLRYVILPTDVLKGIYSDVRKEFEIDESSIEFYNVNVDSGCFEDVLTLDTVTTQKVFVNNFEDVCSVERFVKYWQNVCAQHGCEVIVGICNVESCEQKLEWRITATKIESLDSYMVIDFTSEEALLNAVYWLCEHFREDTFNFFNSLNVTLQCKEV